MKDTMAVHSDTRAGLDSTHDADFWKTSREVLGFGSAQLPVLIGLVIIWTTFQWLNPLFLSTTNLDNLSHQISYGAVVSIGCILVLLIGEVDLSLGSVAGLAAATVAVLVENHHWDPSGAMVLAILVGATAGLVQGFIIERFALPSFVVTLGGLLLLYGLQLYVLGSTGTIRFPFGGTVSKIQTYTFSPGAGYLLASIVVAGYLAAMALSRRRYLAAGLPTGSRAALIVRTALLAFVSYLTVWVLNQSSGVSLAMVILAGLLVLFWAVTTQTLYGRHVYAVGGDREAARRAGIRVKPIRVSVFVLAGMLAAIGGIMLGSYVGAASQTLGGDTLLLYAIAAAVIGGTSLFGGRGSVWSALWGWLVIGSIYNGMFLINLKSDVQYMIIGAVLIGALIVDSLTRRRTAAATR